MSNKANNMPCFHGGAFFENINDDFSNLTDISHIINADVLDAWFEPAPAVVDALSKHLTWITRTSPPTYCTGLINAISKARDIPIDCILPGAGSSDLIFLALTQWLHAASKVIMLDPTYGEYMHICQQVLGCQVDTFPLQKDDNFKVDISRFLQKICQTDYNLVIIVNPNSPTGQHIKKSDLIDLIQQANSNTLFWIDETYIDYLDSSQSLEAFASQTENVLVCKSMSKAYALSGMRVAYLCASSKWLQPLKSLTPPWSISLPGQIAASVALNEKKYYAAMYAQTRLAREQLHLDLQALGVKVIPGVANFLLMFLPDEGPTATTVVNYAKQHNIYLRDASNTGSRLGTYAVRTAVKSAKDNELIIAIIARVMQGQGSPTCCDEGHRE